MSDLDAGDYMAEYEAETFSGTIYAPVGEIMSKLVASQIAEKLRREGIYTSPTREAETVKTARVVPAMRKTGR